MLILHVGLPKTGTTLLQHRIFAHTPGVTFAHRTRGGTAAAVAREFRLYARADPWSALWSRRRLRAGLAALAEAGRPVLVSEESISVSPTRFWRGRGATPDGLARRLAALADGLDPALRPLRLVVGIRRQDQWLASRYAESSREFPEFGQGDFEARMAAIAAAPALTGPLGWLDYARLAPVFDAALGPGSTHLVPLERLVADPEATLAALAGFFGLDLLDPERSPPRMRRPRNPLAVGENVWALRRDGSRLSLPPALEARLRARFDAGNRALAATMETGFGA